VATGVAARAGKFELVHNGTVLLDEIADMEPATQTKILRVPESGTVERLGGSRSMPADARLVSAANKDILALVSENRFREDLYYRLVGVTLFIPPLRERTGDIPLLAGYFGPASNRSTTEVQTDRTGIGAGRAGGTRPVAVAGERPAIAQPS
jgi:Nif-specific regulatory protein